MYDLVQLHRYAGPFQREMIGEIEAAQPQYVVVVSVSSSWLDWAGADRTLHDWTGDYLRRFYQWAGTAYIYPTRSEYAWGVSSQAEKDFTGPLVDVYKRKDHL
jgi:hypothetical protein